MGPDDGPAPNLVVIGAQRGGTSLLWTLLGTHPQVRAAPLRPEPKFFLRTDIVAADASTYHAEVFGAPARPGVLYLEKSTTYLERSDVPARLVACLPDARIVAVLRDPVDRALSNYWFSRQHGVEPLDLTEAFAPDAEARPWPRDRMSASPYHYRRRGHYADLLDPWARVFGDRLHLLRHEDVTHPGPALDDVAHDLGLDPVTWPTEPEPVNASRREDDPSLPPVRRSLARDFARPNAELAERFGVDVADWTTPGDDHDEPGNDLGGHEANRDAGHRIG